MTKNPFSSASAAAISVIGGGGGGGSGDGLAEAPSPQGMRRSLTSHSTDAIPQLALDGGVGGGVGGEGGGVGGSGLGIVAAGAQALARTVFGGGDGVDGGGGGSVDVTSSFVMELTVSEELKLEEDWADLGGIFDGDSYLVDAGFPLSHVHSGGQQIMLGDDDDDDDDDDD